MDSYDLQRFLSDFRDLMSWTNGMKTLVASDELAKDVTGAEALLERHQVSKQRNFQFDHHNGHNSQMRFH